MRNKKKLIKIWNFVFTILFEYITSFLSIKKPKLKYYSKNDEQKQNNFRF